MTEPGYRWVAGLPAATLRELAALAERRQRREFIDPERAAAELAEMLVAGDRPTIGWYRRHGRLDTVERAPGGSFGDGVAQDGLGGASARPPRGPARPAGRPA